MSRALARRSVVRPVAFAAAAAAVALFPARARAAVRTWDGSTSQDWNTIANWTPAILPQLVDDATIGLDTANVTLSNAAFAGNLTINNGAWLQTSGFTLTVATNVTVAMTSASVAQIFVEPGGTGGIGLAANTLVLRTGGELDMSGGHARLNFFDSDQDSPITGSGTIELVGPAASNPRANIRGSIAVDSGTLTLTSGVATARFDLDGQGVGSASNIITVSSGSSRLVVNTPLADAFSSTLVVGDGNEAQFNQAWETAVDGVINLTGGTAAANAARLSGATYTHAGDLRVTNLATIAAPIHFTAGASVTLNAAADVLALDGAITYSGGTFTGPGQIRQGNTANVLANTTIAVGRYDWDGTSGTEVTNVHPGATLTLNVGSIEPSGAENFGGTVNINSGSLFVNTTVNGWTMSGSVNLNNTAGLPVVGGDALNVTGNIRVTNTATIAAVTRLSAPQVTLTAAADSLQFTNAVTLAGGSYTGLGSLLFAGNVNVASDTTADANLRFPASSALTVPGGTTLRGNRETRFVGGNHGGAGTLVNGGSLVVTGNTALTFGALDWDGPLGSSPTAVQTGATLTINAGWLNLVNNQYAATATVTGGTLSVDTAANAWQLTGTINLASAGSNVARVTGDPLLLAGGMINVTTGTARVTAPLSYGPGTIDTAAGARLDLNSPLSSGPAVTLTKQGAGTLFVAGPQAHGNDSDLRVNAGALALGTDAGAGPVYNLNLRVGSGTTAATASFGASQHLRSLAIDNGTAAVAGGAWAVVTNSLTVNTVTGSKLDLNGGALVVRHGGAPSPIAAIRGLIISGYNGGAWTGPGVTSAAAQADPTRAIGYGDATAVLGITGTNTANFHGEIVDATSVLARYTLYGDANLDQAVDFNDLVKLAQNYGVNVAPMAESWWTLGDFTYDGLVDFQDLVRLAQNYGGAIPAAPIPGAGTDFDVDLTRAFASVPEPAMAALLFTGLAMVCGRRRRVIIDAPPT